VSRTGLIVCEPQKEKRRPRAAIDAKFSLYFTMASAVLKGQINFASYSAAALQQDDVLALADRVNYTEGRGPALIEVRLRDGSVKLWNIAALYGSPANPMSEAVLVDKFIDCGKAAQRPLAAARLATLAQQILHLEHVNDMHPLLRAL
jgi:2-methylcitrate dehydratase PrpD